jgi:hypothetical protein
MNGPHLTNDEDVGRRGQLYFEWSTHDLSLQRGQTGQEEFIDGVRIFSRCDVHGL